VGAGLKPVIARLDAEVVGAATNVKALSSVSKPPSELVRTMSAAPAVAAEVVQVTDEVLLELITHGWPPTLTERPDTTNPVPTILMDVPPVAGPEVISTLVIEGLTTYL